MKINFNRDLSEGKKAEVIVRDVLLAHGYYVEDVRDLKSYQVRSIDYVAIHDQQIQSIEVKDDTKGYLTQNFIIEMEAANGRPGWFPKCQATRLFIVSREERLIFSICMKDLKAFMKENGEALREVFIYDQNEDGTSERFSCRLVSRNLLKQHCDIKEISY